MDETIITTTTIATAAIDVPKPRYSRSLSHTRVDTYGQCGRKWQLIYIDHMPQAPGGQLVLGVGLHTAIEYAGNLIKQGQAAPDAMILQAVFLNAFDADLKARDPQRCLDDTQVSELIERGTAMVRAFATDVLPSYSPVDVEASFDTVIPGSDGWRFTGRIDARTMPTQPDGTQTRTIVDFKSASKVPNPVKLAAYEAQATAYALGEVLSGQPLSQQFTFLVFVDKRPRYPGDGEDAQGRPIREAETCVYRFYPTEADALAYADELRDIAWRIEGGEFEPNPTPLCGWCSMVAHCEAGQLYLQDRGRQVQPEIGRFIAWLKETEG